MLNIENWWELLAVCIGSCSFLWQTPGLNTLFSRFAPCIACIMHIDAYCTLAEVLLIACFGNGRAVQPCSQILRARFRDFRIPWPFGQFKILQAAKINIDWPIWPWFTVMDLGPGNTQCELREKSSLRKKIFTSWTSRPNLWKSETPTFQTDHFVKQIDPWATLGNNRLKHEAFLMHFCLSRN